MTYLSTIALSLAITAATFVGLYKYLPLDWLDGPQTFGSTITTIAGTDTLSSSRSVINTNFANLNTDKAEITSTNNFTARQNFAANASTTALSVTGPAFFGNSATSSFSSAGALTLITPLLTPSGGTGSSTLSAFHVLLGSTTNALGIVSGVGTAGQALISNGSGLPPSWQSAGFDTTQNYTFTGFNVFSGSTTMSSTTIGTLNVGSIIATSTVTFKSNETVAGNSTISGTASTTALIVSTTCTGCTGVSSSTATFAAPTTPGTGTATATCGGSKLLSGGGYTGVPQQNSNSTGNSYVNSNGPTAPNAWTVTMYCGAGSCNAGTVTVYAMCVNP